MHSAVEDQNRSVICVGVKAAAVARWSRIMEERRRRATVQYYCGQRERAGGSLNATLRPLWYCEAATAVAPGRDQKLQPPQRIKNWDQNRRQFSQEPKQKITAFTAGSKKNYVMANNFIYSDPKVRSVNTKVIICFTLWLKSCVSKTKLLYSHCRMSAVKTCICQLVMMKTTESTLLHPLQTVFT